MRFPLNVTKQTKIFVYLYLRAKYVLYVRNNAGLGIRKFAHRSFCSNQMSDCLRFAQISQDK